MSSPLRGDAGQVAGIEVLPFGFAILIVGSLLLFNAWAAVDAKFAVVAAAREGARAAAESVDGVDLAESRALAAATAAVRTQGLGSVERLNIELDMSGYARCGRVSVTVHYDVPAIALPIIGGFSDALVMSATHSEIVDGYRGGIDTTSSRC